jgi:hypothetical protein
LIHLFLGLPAGLSPNGFQFVRFLTILSSSILYTCPNHNATNCPPSLCTKTNAFSLN